MLRGAGPTERLRGTAADGLWDAALAPQMAQTGRAPWRNAQARCSSPNLTAD
jgi:hypothetical protein